MKKKCMYPNTENNFMNSGMLFGNQLHVIRDPNFKRLKKLDIFTSDLLNIYAIPGPKLGQASTNIRADTQKVELDFIFRGRS